LSAILRPEMPNLLLKPPVSGKFEKRVKIFSNHNFSCQKFALSTLNAQCSRLPKSVHRKWCYRLAKTWNNILVEVVIKTYSTFISKRLILQQAVFLQGKYEDLRRPAIASYYE